MTDQEIIEIMSETRKEIDRRRELSSLYFYDDIWDREVREMYIHYPDIAALPAGKFKELWDKAA